MKNKLPKLFGSLIMAAFAINSANAQIDYSENFEGTIGWSGTEFNPVTQVPCEGENSFAVNLYGGFVGNTSSETVSPSIGTSDGSTLTLAYDYKIVSFMNPTVPIQNSANWGTFTVYYSTSASGPFTTLETITTTNHVVSASCATHTLTFTPTNGSQVYLKIFAQLEEPINNIYIYFDNISVSAGDCDLTAPEFEDDTLEFCANATAADFPSEGLVWYDSAEGGDVLDGDVELEAGTYYAAQVEGSCESEERTAVTIVLGEPVIADDPEDVMACWEYELPPLENGSYYTATGGTGVELLPGQLIQETALIYVFNDSETVVGCSAENTFTVHIDTIQDIIGENEQTFIAGATVADIDVEGMENGTITWYADEDLTITLADSFVLEDGTYYGLQTNGDCESHIFELVVTIELGTGDFSSSSFKYYPNPVSGTLNLSYVQNISAVSVYDVLGQQVLWKDINQNEAQIDMSLLAAGTYMVKVNAANSSNVIKVVKL
jgi:hypothetical protein